MRSQIDYAACYRILELQPDAPLKEIEERARFLRAAFHPDKFQGQMKDEATEKIKNINVALDNLRAYWAAHGYDHAASIYFLIVGLILNSSMYEWWRFW